MTAFVALDAWAARRLGGSLVSPIPRGLATGTGVAAIDDAWDLTQYVESTAGFEAAEHVLRFVHMRGNPVGAHPVQGARLAYCDFVWALEARLAVDPWYPAKRPVQVCDADKIQEVVESHNEPARKRRSLRDSLKASDYTGMSS